MKKTWREKMADKENLPKILKLEKKFPCYNAVHKMGAEVGDDVVLVNASEVAGVMAKVPKGKLTSTIGICRTIAVPYWRTLKADGSLNEKFPGGAAGQKKLLENEGFRVVQRGKRYLVEGFKDYLG